jgi:hypothetical protein
VITSLSATGLQDGDFRSPLPFGVLSPRHGSETVKVLGAGQPQGQPPADPENDGRNEPPTENHHPICARARAAIAKL